MMPQALTLVLFPHGALCLEETTGTPALDAGVSGRIKEAFARGAGYGLLALGLVTDTPLPPDLAFWRNFACRFIAARCQADADETAAPSIDDWNGFADEAPPMRGGEYLGASVLAELWTSLGAALESELAASGLDLEAYLRGDYQGLLRTFGAAGIHGGIERVHRVGVTNSDGGCACFPDHS